MRAAALLLVLLAGCSRRQPPKWQAPVTADDGSVYYSLRGPAGNECGYVKEPPPEDAAETAFPFYAVVPDIGDRPIANFAGLTMAERSVEAISECGDK